MQVQMKESSQTRLKLIKDNIRQYNSDRGMPFCHVIITRGRAKGSRGGESYLLKRLDDPLLAFAHLLLHDSSEAGVIRSTKRHHCDARQYLFELDEADQSQYGSHSRSE